MKKGANDSPVVHYVGIGASAGGLEAIEEFFSHMPEKSNLAFIVVQHLSPDYKSLMVELLSKKTKIPVHRSADGMTVKPNNIYMIPPKKNLSIFHGRLVLKEKNNTRGMNLSIDIFLRSLAEDKAERAIAIILSGTGSDGTRGVRAIKEQGGMVMVQDETTCKFNGMPRAAVSTGVADFILPPKNMPEQLMAYVGHPYVIGRKTNETLLEDESGLSQIFTKLREKTKVDFTYYKPSTITRRIQRRMSVNQVDRLSDYVSHLQKYPVEIMTLYKELLIGVTNFFRDADAMEALMESMADLIDQAKNRELRFWVTACSTGEEAYTIAILAKEAMEKLGVARDIKIFATDLDRDAIVHAGNGIDPESIAADLTPRMLGKYFYRKEEYYQIARHIREMVVFAQHNLVKDPPFTKIDMISCRNLLIYLQLVIRILPYYIGPDCYSGTILTFFDESLQKKARVELKLLQELVLSFIGEQDTSELYIFKRRVNNQLILENFFPCLGPDADNHLPSSKGKSFYRIWPEYKSLKMQLRIVRSMNENLIQRIHIPVEKEGDSSADFIAISLAEDRIALFLRNQAPVKK